MVNGEQNVRRGAATVLALELISLKDLETTALAQGLACHYLSPATLRHARRAFHKAHVDPVMEVDVDTTAQRVRDVRDGPQRQVLVAGQDLGHESLRDTQPFRQL